MCDNILAYLPNAYTVFTTLELSENPLYDPDANKPWWELAWNAVKRWFASVIQWFNELDIGIKIGVGLALFAIACIITAATIIGEKMQVKAKDFKKISIRGRVAYGICCLENAMEKYKVSGQGWNLLLENLWSFTSLPSEFVPLESGGIEFVLERWFYNIVIRARFIIETEYSLAKKIRSMI